MVYIYISGVLSLSLPIRHWGRPADEFQICAGRSLQGVGWRGWGWDTAARVGLWPGGTLGGTLGGR